MLIAFLAALQLFLALVLASRLAPGRHRRPPVPPRLAGTAGPPVSIVVATLDEAARIAPLLGGLRAQGAPVTEILVVDSGSTDGTRELVADAARADARIRLLTDPPLPADWIGKAWALEHGVRAARNDWILGLDADTEPLPGCAAAIIAEAAPDRTGDGPRTTSRATDAAPMPGPAPEPVFHALSLAPRFAGQGAAERWLQPALLTTLVYRHGAVGDPTVRPDRVMANGQCFLVHRPTLLAHGGYAPVRASFAEDVSLARHLAASGARVGFLDGSRLYRVRSYSGARQLWREWGRSLDLKDAVTPARLWADTLFVAAAQGGWLPASVWLLAAWPALPAGVARTALATGTGALVLMRWLLLPALRGSYERRGILWWLSPLADPLAALRLVLSSARRPTRWRTRDYA